MSLNLVGSIEAVGNKPVNTKFGLKETYSFKVNGQWFKTGFKKAPFNVGDSVSFDYNPGTYGNDVDMATIKPATSVSPAEPPRAVAPSYSRNGSFPVPALDGQRAIIRQNALTNARELYTSMSTYVENPTKVNFDEAVNNVIALARIFEGYTAGDIDMEEVVESMKKE